MAQFNDLIVTGAARFVNHISGTFEKAITDGDGSNISSTYMKKGVDYVDAGRSSGGTVGLYSTAEGTINDATARSSHAEGRSTQATGLCSHTEGFNTVASGNYSHAEGEYNSIASGTASHSEGYGTTASGDYSHAEGSGSTASGTASHADGVLTQAIGNYSHASGYGTISYDSCQFVCGKYNVSDTSSKYSFIIGNGTDSVQANSFTVSWSGMPIMGYTNGVMPSTLPDIGSVLNEQQLIPIVRYLNGCFGTVLFTSVIGGRRPGRYNFIYIPHRTGGENGAALSDNCNYGSLILFTLENPSGLATYSNSAYFLRYSNQSYSGPVRFC